MGGGAVVKSNSWAICLLAALALQALGAASVVINEMELNPPEEGINWVEIYNTGNETVDISGWTATITDGGWIGKFPPVPAGTIIAPKGFYVFNGQSSWNHQNGGFATLYSETGEKVDETPYREDTLGNDFTWGRHPDGFGKDMDGAWGLGYATKGRSNVR
ncbi:MAG: hypothetical protein A4E48_02528 [Methanosaeta sp. PtaU1.Bin060]|nr:MAG: hypothetical protein A4E48_02528 [Methanosaeta sp. PtaU1.Bin060]